MLTNVAKRRVNTTTLWINAVCTQHSERLVRFKYTKTNLLLWQTVLLADDVDYGRAVRYVQDSLVGPYCGLSGSRRVADAVLLVTGEMSVVLPFYRRDK